MSEPYTDEYGRPLTAAQSLMRQNNNQRLYTGALQRSSLTKVPVPKFTVHELAEMAARESEDDPKGGAE